MISRQHMLWAGTTLVLASLGFALGRLEGEGLERDRTHGEAVLTAQEAWPSGPAPSSPAPSATKPISGPVGAPAEDAAGVPGARAAPAPTSAALGSAVLAGKRPGFRQDPSALHLVGLLRSVSPPPRAFPESPLERAFDRVLELLGDKDRGQVLAAISLQDPAMELWEAHAKGPELLAAIVSVYEARPEAGYSEVLVGLLSWVDPSELDRTLLSRLARDWPDDERVRDLIRFADEAAAEPRLEPASAGPTAASSEERAGGGSHTEAPAEAELDEWQDLLARGGLDSLRYAFVDDPRGAEAFLKKHGASPRWTILGALARPQGRSDSVAVSEALRLVEQGWESLTSEDLARVTPLLEEHSRWLPLQRKILTKLAASDEGLASAHSSEASPRTNFLLAVAYAERVGADNESFDLAETYLELLESEPFMARRLLPTLWEVVPRLKLRVGFRIAEDFQSLGDSATAAEVLRHVAPNWQLRAAQAHLAGGHSLAQFRRLVLDDW